MGTVLPIIAAAAEKDAELAYTGNWTRSTKFRLQRSKGIELMLHLISLLAGLLYFTSIANAAELEGTSWRLVEIASMNDTADRPDDPSKYTLEFQTGGRAAIGADCNRGTGTWTSESENQLRFGLIASTRAMCPPGSISDKYLAQFEWVRSYVIKEGHLFLATMADGSIIEFEPAGKAAGSIFGEEIDASKRL